MGGGGQQQTQNTKTEPWEAQQPYLREGFSEAERLYNQGPAEYYPGQTYTDMSAARQAALAGTSGLATGGNPLATNAANYASNTLGGQGDNPYAGILDSGISGMQQTANGAFLNNNPYLDDIYGASADKLKDEWSTNIMPGIASQFGQTNGAGTTMHSELVSRSGGELSDSLGQLRANIYGGNYQQERGRQTDAQQGLAGIGQGLYGTGVQERLNLAGQSGQLRDNQYGDFDKLGQVGEQYEGQQGKVLEDDMNRWNYLQGAPMAALQDFMSMITGNYGSTSTTSSRSKGSPLSSILGAGMTAASMF